MMRLVKWAKTWGASAIIGRFGVEEEALLFRDAGLVVLAQDYKERMVHIPNITGDYLRTGDMAARFFIEKGFRSFAFCGYRDAVWSRERCEGFRSAVERARMGDNFYLYDNQSVDDLRNYESRPLLKWLQSLPPQTALFACDDNQGNRITEICKVNKIRVPEHLAILGVDNDEMICNLSDPSLSSILHDVEEGGYMAAERIDHILRGEQGRCSEDGDVVIQPQGILSRLSTESFSTTDPYVRKALKYIHQNYAGRISVTDVVRQVPLSRRMLEMRFKVATQESVYRYILNLRMEMLAQQLVSGDDPISEVASRVGISSLKNLSRQFKHVKGLTPQEYRARYGKRSKSTT